MGLFDKIFKKNTAPEDKVNDAQKKLDKLWKLWNNGLEEPYNTLCTYYRLIKDGGHQSFFNKDNYDFEAINEILRATLSDGFYMAFSKAYQAFLDKDDSLNLFNSADEYFNEHESEIRNILQARAYQIEIKKKNEDKKPITYNDIKNNKEINTYIEKADLSLKALGYTEHSFAHVTKVAVNASYILETLEYDKHMIDLVKIAGYLHDIGNVVNRVDHSQSGAIMAFRILDHLRMNPADIADIVSAIGNHDEGTGVPVNPIAAALIIADKADVRRSRVRNTNAISFDIHDRVNYSVTGASLEINEEKTIIKLELQIDTEISPVLEYFEIFMNRMILCRKAAESLGLKFKLVINEQSLI